LSSSLLHNRILDPVVLKIKKDLGSQKVREDRELYAIVKIRKKKKQDPPHLRDGLLTKPPSLFEKLLHLLLGALYCPAPPDECSLHLG